MPTESEFDISAVTRDDLADLLPLMRAYCTFYESDPSDEDLRAMSRAFLETGAGGTQLIARDTTGGALGHATMLWSWDTTLAQPLAVMEDLFVTAQARGRGVGAGLIDACRQLAADRGMQWLAWETAPDNETAQRLYDGLADRAGTWLAYRLSTDRPAT
ncbi:GNAT family N-acetyltransferase [Pedococcus bigeumensis]|uniref:GNAT family N-acetyltransferase n=1 Tax=Pedococcus bigeumensis TaxID=433644 RepID=A0A502CMM7_9MICO|nr:GNAT family N-acetyltransferase [Pedococcus bigeumensis]TPG14925.1 GNAT family N-acetyltransferase [Pedococcus bigeumensis]